MDLTLLPPFALIMIVGIIGLLVGSFLNVVIYRLPVMMHRGWRMECADYLQVAIEPTNEEQPFNLVFPLSRCPTCKTPIKPLQNIPVVSYLLLKGRCRHCRTSIPSRYPLVELLTAIISVLVAWKFGASLQTLFALVLSWSLISLSFIDIDQQLLPDSIILPLIWLGLLLSILAYLLIAMPALLARLPVIYCFGASFQTFKLVTGKEGMGYGDFKLLSLFGAWLGWQALPLIILLSSLVGAIIGSTMILIQGKDRNTPIPFGPYLAIAGWIALLWGGTINQYYFNLTGL